MAIQKIVLPDIVLISDDQFKDKLAITVFIDRVEFGAYVDNCGNVFSISKKRLKELL